MQSDLLVEDSRVPRENHPPVASYWQNLYLVEESRVLWENHPPVASHWQMLFWVVQCIYEGFIQEIDKTKLKWSLDIYYIACLIQIFCLQYDLYQTS